MFLRTGRNSSIFLRSAGHVSVTLNRRLGKSFRVTLLVRLSETSVENAESQERIARACRAIAEAIFSKPGKSWGYPLTAKQLPLRSARVAAGETSQVLATATRVQQTST